jgi:hypothetical protein
MLTLKEKVEVFKSYDLKETSISYERINFENTASKQTRKVLARELHESGNGYVLGEYMSKDTIEKYRYKVDSRGWISIKDFNKESLRIVIEEAIKSMS